MSFKAIISGLGFALAPAMAFAKGIEGCEALPIMSHHVIETNHHVIGNGVISYSEIGDICTDELGCTNTEFVLLSACETGRTIRIVAKLERKFDGTRLDRKDEANEIVQKLASADASFSWFTVKATFERKAFQVEEYVESKENCACAVAFPELRNGKEKFEGL
ncbi:hypothetical protein LCM27_02125 [Ruegeria marisrubri]|uniref:hypothetical protein n=1 Tax=Ruegeria marisrubri TaxID=1685379 RepID=UPI001CD47E36|nr:hypothetical protein [Ruegeria marisrubri]MCA0905189.1 hypothetical protein [Ruegeria marisrubri]